jgi:transposase-like protein
METTVSCPYCGQENVILVDESAGSTQQYVEDCQVCCKPWQIIVATTPDGEIDVEVRGVAQ